jgi:hypothetical protein
MNVALTGASSTLARSVIELLDKDDRVETILALDIRPYAGVSSAKLVHKRVDVRNIDALRSAFTGMDAVIHLAFVVVTDVPDARTISAVNIEGSGNVLRAAADSGVNKLIYTSSVSAYGATAGNPPVLTEEMPTRGEINKRNFYYAYTKAAVETIMDDFVRAHPRPVITRFRPQIVVGPNFLKYTGNLFFLSQLAKTSRSYWGFRPDGPNGMILQYTHEEDLAKAILFALHKEMPGAFNIAGEPMDLGHYLQARGKTFRRIPWAAAYGLVSLSSPISARARLAKSWLISAKYRYILDCSKLKQAGFDGPLHTSLGCVREAEAHFAQKRPADPPKDRGNFMRWAAPGWAVITGASSGIGKEFATQLAAQGFSLFLTARRQDRLNALAESLRGAHGVAMEVFAADLGRPEEITRLAERLRSLENLDVLINNAGFATVGPFFETDLERQVSMLNVQNAAPVVLTRTVLPKMVLRNRGVVILTASLSAFMPAPGGGVYTPAKAFLVALARILCLELRRTEVRIQALCPGYTRTEFHDDPAFDGLKAFLPEFAWGTSRQVVQASLRGAYHRKSIVIPGALNRLTAKIVPKRLLLRSYMKKRWDKVRRHDGDPKSG